MGRVVGGGVGLVAVRGPHSDEPEAASQEEGHQQPGRSGKGTALVRKVGPPVFGEGAGILPLPRARPYATDADEGTTSQARTTDQSGGESPTPPLRDAAVAEGQVAGGSQRPAESRGGAEDGAS